MLYNYCVYEYADNIKKGRYYGVTVFINFDIPLVGNYINIPVYGETRIIYDKENITDILNYIIVCLYSNSKDNINYIYAIEHVNKCSLRLKANSNFDMCIDNMLFGIWEEMNENSYRG